jgi:hypothetical protein
MGSGITVQYISCHFKFTVDLTKRHCCEIHFNTNIVKQSSEKKTSEPGPDLFLFAPNEISSEAGILSVIA